MLVGQRRRGGTGNIGGVGVDDVVDEGIGGATVTEG